VEDRGEGLPLAAFLVGSVLAGGNAVGVRYSNRELDPLWGAGFRFALAAILLAGLMALLRLALPRGRALVGAALYGSLNFGAAFALAYYGFVRVHAGLGQTLLAVVPLVTLLLAVLQRQERFRLAALVGSVLALLGIAVLSQAPLREDVPLLSLLALIASAFCFAEAAVVVRRFPTVHPITMNAVGMAVAAVLLIGAALFAGEVVALPERGETWVAIGYLVAIGSIVVFGLYIVVLRYWSASRAAYTFVVVPLVTVVLSAWLDDEPVRLSLVLGGALVLAGVYVGALRRAAA
jgi:drug/metabolite transporter (DMT)-like permease